MCSPCWGEDERISVFDQTRVVLVPRYVLAEGSAVEPIARQRARGVNDDEKRIRGLDSRLMRLVSRAD